MTRQRTHQIPESGTKHLYLIGYGISYCADRSPLVAQYAERAEILFALESDIGHLNSELPHKNIINLMSLYKQGVPRHEAYQQIAEYILAAFSKHLTVGLFVEGSPFFLDSICELLERQANAQGIRIIIVDGRSSLDVIIQSLRIPLGYGLGVYLAEDFCAGNCAPNAESVNIFFQPGNVGTERIQIEDVGRSGVQTLKERLLEYYQPTDRWLLINLGHAPTVSTKIIWGRLNDLDTFYSYMHSGTLILSRNWWPDVLSGHPPTLIERG